MHRSTGPWGLCFMDFVNERLAKPPNELIPTESYCYTFLSVMYSSIQFSCFYYMLQRRVFCVPGNTAQPVEEIRSLPPGLFYLQFLFPRCLKWREDTSEGNLTLLHETKRKVNFSFKISALKTLKCLYKS